jgi:hypothetical protein
MRNTSGIFVMENDIFDALEIDYLTILQIFQLDIIKSIRIQSLQKSSIIIFYCSSCCCAEFNSKEGVVVVVVVSVSLLTNTKSRRPDDRRARPFRMRSLGM